MTTAEQLAALTAPQPWFRRASVAVRAFASASRRKTLVTSAKALVAAIQGRYTLAQLAGASAAFTGAFLEWGTAIGLMVTGVAVLSSSIIKEWQTGGE